MPLVAPHDWYGRAFRERWALGAFNTSNLEMTQAIVWGLREAQAPGIVQVTETGARYAGLATILGIIASLAQDVPVPVIVHCDHGKTEKHVRACIDLGFPSVMIDGSSFPFAENVRRTRSVVRYARLHDVWVEGEVGVIRGKEGLTPDPSAQMPVSRNEKLDAGSQKPEAGLTDPTEAARFVEETNVDALAISVGTLHGAFQGREAIRFARLEEIHRSVPKTPLVLHGASGLPAEELTRAVGLGVAKVNIDTALQLAFQQGLTKGLSAEEYEEGIVDPRNVLAPARDAVQAAVRDACAVLGSAGKGG